LAAIEALDDLPGSDERRSEIYSVCGRIFHAMNRLPEAREAFEQAVANLTERTEKRYKNRLRKEVYWNLATVYYDLGDFEKSISTLHQVLSLYPQDDLYRRNILAWLGQSYHAKGDLNDAVGFYRQVLNSPNASGSEKASIYQGLGKVFFDLGNYDAALYAFNEAVSFFTWGDEFYGDLLLWLGGCYEAKNDHKQAQQCYTKILGSISALQKYKDLAEAYLAQLPDPYNRVFH